MEFTEFTKELKKHYNILGVKDMKSAMVKIGFSPNSYFSFANQGISPRAKRALYLLREMDRLINENKFMKERLNDEKDLHCEIVTDLIEKKIRR